IITPLPGPKAKSYLEKDQKFVSPSSTKEYPLVVKTARGNMVEDVDGNKFLDFTAGVAVCSTGHCHPEVIEAIKRQAETLIHMSGADFYNPLHVELAEKLSRISPGTDTKRTFFGNSGAEAVETAFKLARYHTKRPMIIAFYNAFHGRTMGALSLTGSRTTQRKGFFPLIPGVIHVPYAYCYRCYYGLTKEKCGMWCAGWIKEELFQTVVPPEEVAAIFVEPVQGEGGYIVPPKEFLDQLYKLTREYGILYVADEVQAGMGRTGKMFACEHFGIVPDIITLAKGIASGMPVSATVAPQKIMDWGPGTHASTFGGNPVAISAALKTIELLENGLIANAARIGAYIIKQLKAMEKTHRLIGDVRGLGLMIGIELVRDKKTKERAVKERNELLQKAFKKGLLLLGCSRNSVRFCPSLVTTKEEADTALTIFEDCLDELEKR
ncbi:MAG TPA: acetyl ornithine aminotransferase family protein, partial [Candidatus Brocadiales bacterium]|nr:acetyl ornithine aminotransferase family protein [Candidatus Brocadiales bacterium]